MNDDQKAGFLAGLAMAIDRCEFDKDLFLIGAVFNQLIDEWKPIARSVGKPLVEEVRSLLRMP